MEKKSFYLPKAEEIKYMESYRNVNIYKYLLVKTIEKILTNNTHINELDNSLKDNQELIDAICYIYPQELLNDSNSKNNLALLRRLLNKKTSNKIYMLDNIALFSPEVQSNYGILLEAIDTLYEELPHNPEYRFNYKKSIALDSIFYLDKKYFNRYPNAIIDKLIELDPAYTLKLPNNTNVSDNVRVAVSIDKYADTYGIPYNTGREYLNTNIFNNSDYKVKTLIKYLYNKH